MISYPAYTLQLGHHDHYTGIDYEFEPHNQQAQLGILLTILYSTLLSLTYVSFDMSTCALIEQKTSTKCKCKTDINKTLGQTLRPNVGHKTQI